MNLKETGMLGLTGQVNKLNEIISKYHKQGKSIELGKVETGFKEFKVGLFIDEPNNKQLFKIINDEFISWQLRHISLKDETINIFLKELG